MLDSMSGSANSCYDKNNLTLSSISSSVSFTVNIDSTTGTVSSITITDTGQGLTASGTTINNIALTTYNSSTLSCSGSSSNNNNQQQQQEPQSTFGGTLVAATTGDTHKGIVYLDPKDLTATCTASSTLTTTNTGCKKFYIFDDSGTTYKMLMWKNTSSGNVVWNSNNVNTSMLEVATALSTDTNGWEGSPRLITADEVASIVGITNATTDTPPGTGWASSKTYADSPSDLSTQMSWFYFDGSGSTYSSSDGWQKQTLTNSKSKYTWLYDYTNGCTSKGCDTADSSTYGYWTSTARTGSADRVWYVTYYGYLDYSSANIAGIYGVRPVIEIAKSAIQ